jgi:CRP/FNR family cyclic AMP-dependent transcriptional regulator
MTENDFPRMDASSLQQNAVRQTFKKGEKILRPHDEPTKIYTVISGYVKAYNINDQGIEQIQIIYGELEVFPVAWLVGKNRIRMYFEAMTDCVVDALPQDTLRTLLKTRPDVSYVMISKLVGLFLTYVQQVDNLEYTYASERLAYRLLIVGAQFGEETEDGVLLPGFSYQTFGSMINLSRESVNREIAKLVEQKLVVLKDSRIYLTNLPALRKKVDRDGTNLILDDLSSGPL